MFNKRAKFSLPPNWLAASQELCLAEIFFHEINSTQLHDTIWNCIARYLFGQTDKLY
jgi:hypothetical protein